MEAFLAEKLIPKVTTGPIDLDAGANTGARVDIRGGKRVTFIAMAAAGTAPNSHTFSFKQHNAASAGTSKVLSHSNPYWHKLNAATSYTKVEPSAAADAYDLDTLVGDAKYVLVFEVLAEDVDGDGGYGWVSLDQSDAGGAQLGAILAIVDSEVRPAYDQVV